MGQRGLPENVQECLEKFAPDGFVLIYATKNKDVRAFIHNPDLYVTLSDLYQRLPDAEPEDNSPPDCMDQIVIPL